MRMLTRILVVMLYLTVVSTEAIADSDTFGMIAADNEDTWGNALYNQNLPADGGGCSAKRSALGYCGGAISSWWRWPLTIPKGATITNAYITVTSSSNMISGDVMRLLALITDNKWEVSGFSTGNYANYTALAAIATQGTYVDWTLPAMTAGSSYNTPALTNLVQARIDDADYDPSHSENKFIGLRAVYQSGGAGCANFHCIYGSNEAYPATLYVEWTPAVEENSQGIIFQGF